MIDPSLQAAADAARERVLGLEGKLAKRREAEAAELELLESQRAQVKRDHADATARREKAANETTALTTRAQTLEQGLSQARRVWVRLFEPTLAGLALFAAIVSIGAAYPRYGRAIVLELLGLATGVVLALVWYALRRKR